MIIYYILNLLVLLQLASAIYSFVAVKDSNFDNDDSEKTRKLSLTTIIILSILILLINLLYIFKIINKKRVILNIILLSIVSSVFLFTNFIYLDIQKRSPTGYQNAYNNLENNSENVNKYLKDYNLTIGIITIICNFLILSFFIGYNFFSKIIIKKIKEPVIVENINPIKKSKFVRLNFFD